ncbi:MAG: hypothetical protein K2Y22_16925 [Candidatus Obscuribacterales bacterium]|nr:hypothetical protein [Candidatus Obscuribacterales bacterium]
MPANLDKVTDIAESVCKKLGYIFVDARIGQSGSRRCLTVTIHNEDGHIGFEDCEKVSRTLEELLDNEEPPLIQGAFLLEVESPGLDRELKTEREFAVFKGYPVEVKARQKLDGIGDSFTGTLMGLKDGIASFANPKPIVSKSKNAKTQKAKSAKVQTLTLPKKLEVELSKLNKVRLYPEVES